MRRLSASPRSPVAAAALLLALTACSRDRPVRVVLITVDTLRHDSIAGGQGDEAGPMPHLAAWSRRATRFDSCWAAAPSTQPTHASLLTGLHPWQHGVARNRLRLDGRFDTVAERLSAAGFSTAAVVASYPVSRRFGFAQGFDRFEDEFAEGRVGARWRGAAGGAGESETGRGYYSLADAVLTRAERQIADSSGPRQFFWFHFFDPHSPYGDAAELDAVRPRSIVKRAAEGHDVADDVERARRLYDLDLRVLDRALERLLARLAAETEQFETHIAVTADHGESFGEHGSIAHGRRLIPSQIRVPCLIRSPLLEPGDRPGVVGSIDFAPTMLAMAGVDPSAVGGRDLTRPGTGPSRAFGMRRGFDPPFEDQRVDGTVELLDERLYYTVTEEHQLLRGHGRQLLPPIGPGEPLSEPARSDLMALFAAFEKELLRSPAEGLTDPESERALRALGYIR